MTARICSHQEKKIPSSQLTTDTNYHCSAVFQALPPSLRSAWRYLEGSLYNDDIAVQDKHPQETNGITCIKDFHRRAAQPFDTKCAICRSSMAPEEGFCHPFADFDICQFLLRRRERRSEIAPGWDTPSKHPFGYNVWTRATEGTLSWRNPHALCLHRMPHLLLNYTVIQLPVGPCVNAFRVHLTLHYVRSGDRGPAFVVCNWCHRHPFYRHFTATPYPQDMLFTPYFAPPTTNDLGHMSPVRAHDRYRPLHIWTFQIPTLSAASQSMHLIVSHHCRRLTPLPSHPKTSLHNPHPYFLC